MGKRSFVIVVVVIVALAALIVGAHTRGGGPQKLMHMIHGK